MAKEHYEHLAKFNTPRLSGAQRPQKNLEAWLLQIVFYTCAFFVHNKINLAFILRIRNASRRGVVRSANMKIGAWHTINDTVMGGESSSELVATKEGLLFHGQLSLQNNGGFASVRALVTEDLANSTGIRLTVKGDGRDYQVRLRQDRNFDGASWAYSFSTDGSIQVIEALYPDFEPVFRGRKLQDAGALEAAMIAQIGFLIADRIEAEFSLSILDIQSIR